MASPHIILHERPEHFLLVCWERLESLFCTVVAIDKLPEAQEGENTAEGKNHPFKYTVMGCPYGYSHVLLPRPRQE